MQNIEAVKILMYQEKKCLTKQKINILDLSIRTLRQGICLRC
jgi:hypothetical protein